MKLKNLLPQALCVLFFASSKIFAQVPVANFSVNPNPVCANATLQITDMSTNSPLAWSYTITGAAPATSTLQNPAVIYANGGIYNITLVATNGAGSSLPVIKTVTVLPAPNVLINPIIQNMCIGGGPLLFTDMQVGPGVLTFSWNTGATTNSISVSPTVTTVYTCVATNTMGCSMVRTCTAVVNPLPTVTITANPITICPGGSSTLIATATGPGPWTYTWSTAAITNSIVSALVGVYSVTVTNVNGCKGTKSYTLNSSPSLSLTATASPTSVCTGGSSTLSVTGATSYTWSTGSTFSLSLVTPTATTTYSVIGVNGACTGSTTVMVTLNTIPSVTATSSPPAICSGKSATLTGTGAGTYTWNPGSLTGSNVAVTPTINTTYTVVGANGNCTNTRTVSVIVNPNPTLTAVSNNSVLCIGQTATITGSGGCFTYTWTPPGITSPTIAVSPTVTTTYTLVCSNGFGCIGTFVITQSVSTCAGVQQLTNTNSEFGVSPNPNNGEFVISIKQITDNTFVEIYNGLGQLIHSNSIKEISSKINLAKESEGIYHLRIIQDGKSVYNIKILKN